jgi:hypothetical protein
MILDFFARWCTLSYVGEFPLGRQQVKKILITVLLAATPFVTLASQEPQGTTAEPQSAPATGSSASSSHHARRHHKRSKNSHHRAQHHRTSKQHSQTQ